MKVDGTEENLMYEVDRCYSYASSSLKTFSVREFCRRVT